MVAVGHRAHEAILTGLEIVGHFFAEFGLEGFELRRGDGAGAADAGSVVSWAGCSGWDSREFFGRLGIIDEVNLLLGSVGGGLRHRTAVVQGH